MESKDSKQEPKQVELSAARAQGLRAAIDLLNHDNALMEERVRRHEEAAAREREAFSRTLAIHQTHIAALVTEAGLKLEDFQQYGVIQDGGKWYLRQQVQTPTQQ